MECVIAFKTTSYAIKAEQCLLKEKLNIKVMPLPSEIRAGCGICLRVAEEEIKAAIKILDENNITQFELFSMVKDSGKVVYGKADVASIA